MLCDVCGACPCCNFGGDRVLTACCDRVLTIQESSYERLYRWTQSTCRSLTQPSAEHPSILIPALRALRNRSVLYQFCITELAQARHSAVVRGFIDALTRGGPGGLPKPIELHSHDPVRYCRWVAVTWCSSASCAL